MQNSLYIYIYIIWFPNIFVDDIFERVWAHFLHIVKCSHLFLRWMLLLNINHLFAHSVMFSSIAMYH